jgi:hypothetical protein
MLKKTETDHIRLRQGRTDELSGAIPGEVNLTKETVSWLPQRVLTGAQNEYYIGSNEDDDVFPIWSNIQNRDDHHRNQE